MAKPPPNLFVSVSAAGCGGERDLYLFVAPCVCLCVFVCAQAGVRIDLNGIIDLLYSLITLGISRPDGGFSLLTGPAKIPSSGSGLLAAG